MCGSSARALVTFRVAAVAAAMLALASPEARSQPVNTLRLDFAFEDPGLADRAGDRALRVADSLAALCTRMFGLWTFQAGPSSESAAVRVTLLGQDAENVRFEVLDQRGVAVGTPWECVFRGPFPTDAMPPWRTGMPVELPKALERRLLVPARDTLLALLARSHPVAVLGDTRLPGEASCALPLPYSRFEYIAGSHFVLAGTSDALGRVLIRSAGSPLRSAPWGDPALFQGLSVTHVAWVGANGEESIDLHIADLPSLANVKVLIEVIVRNPLAGVFDAAPGTGGNP